MPSIHTLVPDIYKVLETEHDWITESFSTRLSAALSRSNEANGASRKGTLRLSKMGDQCPRALWCSVHTPECAQALPPWAVFKYTYGHVIEALALELIRAAGHRVEGEQDECSLDGIHGHRDAVVDGAVVDVKSCTSYTLAKLKNNQLATSDNFGYLFQLDGYVSAAADDPLVVVKDKGYILGVDKTLGHFALYEHRIRPQQIRARVSSYKQIVSLDEPPACTCETKPYGASGNRILETTASYSAFKFECFPHLRTFLYADGPKYFTRVERKPDVPEVDRDGKLLFFP